MQTLSPPTSTLTVPEEVPAGLLATQLYWPASTSCTPRMCKVPRRSSCSTKGAEPTSSSPANTKQTKLLVFTMDILTVIFMYILSLTLPLNQWTRGEGMPLAWHSRVASPPTATSTVCCTTVIVGTSEGKNGKFKMQFNLVFFLFLSFCMQFYYIWK